MFKNDDSICVKCIPAKTGTSPEHVLRALKKQLDRIGLRREDEAWIVVDKDSWSDEQLGLLHAWSCEKDSYGLAVSNPMFEFWLLLHFEDGRGISSPQACMKRLRRYLPHYKKGCLEIQKMADGVQEAIERGRQRDNPPCADWPRSYGTTVHRLVARLRTQ